jgi:hypothetical protein
MSRLSEQFSAAVGTIARVTGGFLKAETSFLERVIVDLLKEYSELVNDFIEAGRNFN